jgi:hypothetical protein
MKRFLSALLPAISAGAGGTNVRAQESDFAHTHSVRPAKTLLDTSVDWQGRIFSAPPRQ